MDFICRYLVMICVFAVLLHFAKDSWRKHYIAIICGMFLLIGLIFLL